MGESEGSSRSISLTESGRTPLAVLLGDTSEIEREVEAALGRISADAETLELDSALEALDELSARRRAQPLRPPQRRHHASAIAGRIHDLAQEAYALEEARRARREEPSERNPILRAQPGWVNHPAQEELIASLPWALRQHLVKEEGERDRPFVLGALIGAAVAVITGLTFTLVWTWSATPQSQPLPAPSTIVAQPATQGREVPAGPYLLPSQAAMSPAASLSHPLGFDPLRAASVPLNGAAPAAEGLAPKTLESAPAAQAPALAAATPVRRPRTVKEAPLARRANAPPPAPSELNFDEGEAEVAPAIAAEDPGPPPPSEQELDDAFEREFGVAAGAAGAAPRRTVFVPPPVAELPATLSESEILQTVIAHKAAIAGCVAAHTEASDEKRTIVLSWVLEPSGTVSGLQVATDSLRGSALGRCMVDAVQSWKFAPHREAQPVRFPFSY